MVSAFTVSHCGFPSRRQISNAQERDVRAWRQTKLHSFVLTENRKITGVTRVDHAHMLRILVAEACRADANRGANADRWRVIMRAVERECLPSGGIFSIAPDPYSGALAKLSSMMLWNGDEVRHWNYRYTEEELARRKAAQQRTLAALFAAGGPRALFFPLPPSEEVSLVVSCEGDAEDDDDDAARRFCAGASRAEHEDDDDDDEFEDEDESPRQRPPPRLSPPSLLPQSPSQLTPLLGSASARKGAASPALEHSISGLSCEDIEVSLTA